ncbi:MAG: hypothetical protein EA393_07620 [Bacteroidetes bacterium]|nr:MAG: hypothetical protein EA393_07620 [Bacteroidota bacterium]
MVSFFHAERNLQRYIFPICFLQKKSCLRQACIFSGKDMEFNATEVNKKARQCGLFHKKD